MLSDPVIVKRVNARPQTNILSYDKINISISYEVVSCNSKASLKILSIQFSMSFSHSKKNILLRKEMIQLAVIK